uniref:Olfactory receptor n=1 Tax=Bos mutus grunniens TaxID=30521 RepID=A0A8B9Z229_BOSMU
MEFVLLIFADVPHLQGFLFELFLLIYIIILMGNGIIFLITKLDPGLQTSANFFLGNFSLLEICYVPVTLPRMLTIACATHMCFILILGATECVLLAVMAYDRYAAICSPLHYPLVMNFMNYRVCIQLVAGQTGQIFSLPFCDSNLINHFFCDIPPILKLACGDTFLNEMLVFTVSALFVLVPFLLILVSYGKIISTVLKLPSATSRGKAFSTCSSHLTVVALFFGSGLVTYLRPRTQGSAGTDKVLSLFYLIVTPVFNPMIYSLRNKDVMMALRQWPCKYLNSLKN